TAASAPGACTSTMATCESGSGVSRITDASPVATDQPAGTVNVAPPGVASGVSEESRRASGFCCAVPACALGDEAATVKAVSAIHTYATRRRRMGPPGCAYDRPRAIGRGDYAAGSLTS